MQSPALLDGGPRGVHWTRVTIRDPARLAALARGDEDALRGEGHVT
jgi:hypothetical protein